MEKASLKAYTLPAVTIILCLSVALFVGVATAQTEPTPVEDPVFFVVGDGAVYSGGTGWYAGYVINGQSGTYTLRISANGPQSRFPVVNTRVIVCISDEALSTATVTIGSNTTTPLKITSYTAGQPSYYGASGGVFAEPDYYGYNDAYTLNSLTYDQIHHPTNYYPLQVTVTFSSSATADSKVMFLCYGTDSKGDDAKTPFSEGTLLTPLPEYEIVPVAFLASFGAYALYKKKNSK